MFIFIYTDKIQYEKYQLKCYIMKKESLSIIVSHINVVVNQTDAYKIQNKKYINKVFTKKHLHAI